MSLALTLSAKSLRRAAALREKIDKLTGELAAILGAGEIAPAGVKAAPVPAKKIRRRFSPAARAKMAAAAKKRWAEAKASGKKSL